MTVHLLSLSVSSFQSFWANALVIYEFLNIFSKVCIITFTLFEGSNLIFWHFISLEIEELSQCVLHFICVFDCEITGLGLWLTIVSFYINKNFLTILEALKKTVMNKFENLFDKMLVYNRENREACITNSFILW